MDSSKAPAPAWHRCTRRSPPELLALLDKAPFKWWHDRRWGVKALSAMGKKAEAIRYAEESRGLNDPGWQIAQACEEILLSSGLLDEAYRRYAIEANQGTTNLATFRAIAKKYPHKQSEEILLTCSQRLAPASGSPPRRMRLTMWRSNWSRAARPAHADTRRRDYAEAASIRVAAGLPRCAGSLLDTAMRSPALMCSMLIRQSRRRR